MAWEKVFSPLPFTMVPDHTRGSTVAFCDEKDTSGLSLSLNDRGDITCSLSQILRTIEQWNMLKLF